MRNIKNALAFLFFGCALAYAQQQALPKLDVPDPDLRTVFTDSWWSRIAPAFDKMVGFPKQVTTFHIMWNPDPNWSWAMNNGLDTVYMPRPIFDPKSVLSSKQPGAWIMSGALAEMTHCATGSLPHLSLNSFDEAIGGLGAYKTIEELKAEGYPTDPEPSIFLARLKQSLPRNAVAGGSILYESSSAGGWNDDYMGIMTTGGYLKPLVAALRALVDQKVYDPQPYFNAMDQTLPKLDGKLPSTVYRSWVGTFTNGPDGTAFAVYPQANILDENGNIAYTDSSPIIRKDNMLLWAVQKHANGHTVNLSNSGKIYVQVLDSQEKLVMEARPYDSNNLLFWPATPPNGLYKVKAYGCPDLTSGVCDPAKATHTHILPLPALDDPLWYKDGFLLLANGDGQGGGFEQVGKVDLQFPDLDARVTYTKYPGGLYYFKLNGFRGDVKAKDDARTYTFTLKTDQTQVAYWTNLTQPYIYVATDAAKVLLADNQSPNITTAPGGWMTAWTWGASENDPAFAASLPLPANLSGVEALVTDSLGKQHQAGLSYTSQLQVNLQIPYEVALGKAKVQIKTGAVISNAVEIEVVPYAPNIFPMGTTASGKTLGAVTDAFTGTLVTAEQPAKKGSWISIWLNSLGQTAPPQESNKAALFAARTVNPVVVKIGTASCLPDYAGIAPGFAGLYQINLNLAACQGLTAGTQLLGVSVNGQDSAPVEVVIQ